MVKAGSKIAKLLPAPQKSCSVSVGIVTHSELGPQIYQAYEYRDDKDPLRNCVVDL